MHGSRRLMFLGLFSAAALSSCGPEYLVLKDGRAIECDRATYSEMENAYICRSDGDIFLVDESMARDEAPLVDEIDGLEICPGAPGRVSDGILLGGLAGLLERLLETAPAFEGATVLFRFSDQGGASERAMAARLADSMNETVAAAGFSFSGDKIRELLSKKLDSPGTGCGNRWNNMDAAAFFGVELLLCAEIEPETGHFSLYAWDVEKGMEVFSGSAAPAEPPPGESG